MFATCAAVIDAKNALLAMHRRPTCGPAALRLWRRGYVREARDLTCPGITAEIAAAAKRPAQRVQYLLGVHVLMRPSSSLCTLAQVLLHCAQVPAP